METTWSAARLAGRSDACTPPTNSRVPEALCPAPCEAACVLGDKGISGQRSSRASGDHRPGVRVRVGVRFAPGGGTRADGRGDRLRPGRDAPHSSHQGPGTAVTSSSATTPPAACCDTASRVKLEKRHVDRRHEMRAEGNRVPLTGRRGQLTFRGTLRYPLTAIVLAGGARVQRDLRARARTSTASQTWNTCSGPTARCRRTGRRRAGTSAPRGRT